MNYLSPKSVFNRIGWFVFVLIAILNYVQVVVCIPIAFFDPELLKNSNFLLILTIVSLYIIGFPMFVLCMTKLEGKAVPKSERKKLSIGQFLKFFVISFAVINITNLINVAFQSLFHMVMDRKLGGALDDIMNKPSILIFVTTCIFAPIVEEYMFRYLIFNKIRKYGDRVAIFTTAVLFGLFHMNFEQFIYAVALGVVFGYIVSYTGNVKYTILLHALVNFFGGTLGLLITSWNNNVVLGAYSIFSFVMCILGVVLICLNVKKIRLNPPIERIAHPWSTIIGNPGMIVLGIVVFLTMILTLVSQIVEAFTS